MLAFWGDMQAKQKRKERKLERVAKDAEEDQDGLVSTSSSIMFLFIQCNGTKRFLAHPIIPLLLAHDCHQREDSSNPALAPSLSQWHGR